MLGVLLYKKADIEKNAGFLYKFTEHSRQVNMDVVLWVYEETVLDGRTCLINGRQVDRPDFVVNRSREYQIAEDLERMGIRVFNRSAVSYLGNDKDVTYQWVEKLGISIMRYRIFDKKSFGNAQFPCVLKSCSGHGGTEVFFCNSEKDMLQYAGMLKGKKSIVQQLADGRREGVKGEGNVERGNEGEGNKGEDIRVYVVGGVVVAAMLRKAGDGFLSNYSVHGNACMVELDKDSRKLVDRIISRCDFDFVGIDLVFHRGKPVLNEIEDAVGSRMVYENTDIDIIKIYVEYIKRTMCK